MRAGTGFTALLTAGEKGDTIAVAFGDCAIEPSGRIVEVEEGGSVLLVMVSVEGSTDSFCAGSSK